MCESSHNISHRARAETPGARPTSCVGWTGQWRWTPAPSVRTGRRPVGTVDRLRSGGVPGPIRRRARCGRPEGSSTTRSLALPQTGLGPLPPAGPRGPKSDPRTASEPSAPPADRAGAPRVGSGSDREEEGGVAGVAGRRLQLRPLVLARGLPIRLPSGVPVRLLRFSGVVVVVGRTGELILGPAPCAGWPAWRSGSGRRGRRWPGWFSAGDRGRGPSTPCASLRLLRTTLHSRPTPRVFASSRLGVRSPMAGPPPHPLPVLRPIPLPG